MNYFIVTGPARSHYNHFHFLDHAVKAMNLRDASIHMLCSAAVSTWTILPREILPT